MHIVPYPQSLTRNDGHFNLAAGTAVIISKQAAQSVCIRHALKCLNLQTTVSKEQGDWVLSIGDYRGKTSKLKNKPEAYTLDCDKTGAQIHAADKDGLFWALTTVQQILNGTRKLQSLRMSDYPAQNLRYHHDDISRKQVSKLADFKRILRHLSQFKIKYYTPYMEDMLFLKSYPDIGEGRGRLEANEIAAMHKEAEKYNITIFPTYSLIGHQENLLQLKKYRKYAQEVFQEPSSYDPRKKILRPYLLKIIDDVCALFPDSPYFHACFDEIQGLPTAVIIKHANWCAAELQKRGKKMLMWIDMFKNHNAISAMDKLHKNIIPVEWNYDRPGNEIDAYQKIKRPVTGLAGYNNWCAFLPDFTRGKNNITGWTKTIKKLGSDGLGCSMWGDNGYENARDLCWNLYAFLGECAWRGTVGPKNFEQRFQTQFYGKAITPLQKLIETELPKRQISARQLWQLFRYPLSGLQRSVHNDPKLIDQARQQLTVYKRALILCSQARKQCLREAAHIDHFVVGILREQLVLKRLLLAQRMNTGMRTETLATALKQLRKDISSCKKAYQKAWLRHNKRENIDVSLAVYTFLDSDCVDSLRMHKQAKKKVTTRYQAIDLNLACNANMNGVYGVPIGYHSLDQIPFQFPDVHHTHVAIEPQASLDISLNGKDLTDLHLIYGGQTSHDKKPKKCLRIKLYQGARCIFNEQLKSIEDICCWWAPRGDHMWAGGGLKYVNQKRTSYAYDCRNFHGLLHLQHFQLPRHCEADRLCLEANGNETIALFALSLEQRA